MAVYYWLVVLVLLFGLLMHGEQKGNTKYIFVVAILLFCVLGLRDAYTVGNDSSSSYRLQFERMEDKHWSDLGGPFDWVQDLEEQSGRDDKNAGLEYLMKIVYDWTDGDYQAFIVLISFFVILANAHLVKKYSPSPLQAFLYFFGLLYFSFHFNALKQSVAMIFIIYAFDAIIDRKLLKFLLLVTAASVFHYPALVFLPAYWIGNMRIGRGYIILLAAIMLVIYFFRDEIVQQMSDIYYGEDSGHNIATNERFLMNKVIVMLVIIAAALVIRPPDPSDRVYCSFLSLVGVAAAIQTFAAYGNVFERLADYYFQFSFVFIPMVFEGITTKRRYLSEKQKKMICRVGPYLFCAFAIWRFLDHTSNDPNVCPYKFFFQSTHVAEELLQIHWPFL